jgi:hypothetical protein
MRLGGAEAIAGSASLAERSRTTRQSVRQEDVLVALLVVLVALTLAGFGVLCAHCVRDPLLVIDGSLIGSPPLPIPFS